MRVLRSDCMVKVSAIRYAPNAHMKPSGTNNSRSYVKSAAPKAWMMVHGSVMVNTMFDTNAPGVLPSLPLWPMMYPAAMTHTNARTLMRAPSMPKGPFC